MNEQEVQAAVKACFRNARVGQAHCYFGDPVRDEDCERTWSIRFPGDSITLGGMTLPLHSRVVACPTHDAQLVEVYGE